jgi:hypothetical protein
LVLLVSKRSRGSIHSVFLGKVTVSWLLATFEALQQAEGLKEFVKSSRVGNKAFIVWRSTNKFGSYLAIVENGGGGRRGLVIIPKGRGCRVLLYKYAILKKISSQPSVAVTEQLVRGKLFVGTHHQAW